MKMSEQFEITVKWQNKTQAELAKTMWYNCKSMEEVNALKEKFGFDAVFVHMVLAAEILDRNMDTNISKPLLDQIAERSKWSSPGDHDA